MKSIGSMSILPPKLPPMGGWCTVIWRQSSSRVSASALRYMETMWTPVQTSSWPSDPKLARQTCVSIEAGAESGLE